ncbi:MAG: hypothetical protein SCALA702_36780 [Melioribacteraceae bacterium]|nr:MAG: hypothetical protein SCALA702_36780 [Melioribacteraceae bacterium]
MKKIIVLVGLFLLFAVLSGLNDTYIQGRIAENSTGGVKTSENPGLPTYNFQISGDSLFQQINVVQIIGIPEDSAEKIILDWLPAKIFHSAEINEYNKSLSDVFVIDKITSGGFELSYTFSEDSAQIRILPEDIQLNTIQLEYSIFPPTLVSDFGKASGKEFYFFSNWYAKLENVRESIYSATYEIPTRYQLASNLEIIDETKVLLPEQISPAFTWFAGEDMEVLTKSLPCDTCKVKIEVYSQQEKTEYSERIAAALLDGINYLEQNIDDFPYSKLVVIDFPRTFYGEQDYPGVISVKSGFISPRISGVPELEIFEGLSRQYFGFEKFYDLRQNQFVYYSLNDYMSELLYEQSFGIPSNFFSFAEFYPIPGLLFLAYNHIPILYTLGDYELPRGAKHLPYYYRDRLVSKIIDDSGKNNDFTRGMRYKAALSFLTVEKSIGVSKHLEILREVYHSGNDNDFSTSYVEHLKSLPVYGNNLAELFTQSFTYSYKIDYLVQTGDSRYELKITRTGDGIFPIDIKINKEPGSSLLNWDGKERFKIVTFSSEEKVKSVEIDPQRKNMLDVNFTDNSYTLDAGYTGAWSISMRWFFWIQNALMILGSVG